MMVFGCSVLLWGLLRLLLLLLLLLAAAVVIGVGLQAINHGRVNKFVGFRRSVDLRLAVVCLLCWVCFWLYNNLSFLLADRFFLLVHSDDDMR